MKLIEQKKSYCLKELSPGELDAISDGLKLLFRETGSRVVFNMLKHIEEELVEISDRKGLFSVEHTGTPPSLGK